MILWIQHHDHDQLASTHTYKHTKRCDNKTLHLTASQDNHRLYRLSHLGHQKSCQSLSLIAVILSWFWRQASTLIFVVKAIDNIVEAGNGNRSKWSYKAECPEGNWGNAVWTKHVERVGQSRKEEAAATDACQSPGQLSGSCLLNCKTSIKRRTRYPARSALCCQQPVCCQVCVK